MPQPVISRPEKSGRGNQKDLFLFFCLHLSASNVPAKRLSLNPISLMK
jgi:hypothetical protein